MTNQQAVNAPERESRGSASRLFPAHLLHASWQEFEARGYTRPVTGIVYRGLPRPTCGMPLGGIDTGCIDIEPNGMLGYCTVFNHLIQPRPILNTPFLGLKCGDETHVLVSDTQAKAYAPVTNEAMATWPKTDYTPVYSPSVLAGVSMAKSIDYWGHYPIVDMEYAIEGPLSVGLRACSPFIPGDTVASMAPAAVFEVEVRNQSADLQQATLAFSFPGFEVPEGGRAARRDLDDGLNGVCVTSSERGNAWEAGYVLSSLDTENTRRGGSLDNNGEAWSVIDRTLPGPDAGQSGAALAVDLALAPQTRQTVRFVLAWHAPHWRAGGAPSHEDTDLHTHMYVKHYPDPESTVRWIAERHDGLLRRIIAWQEVVFQDPDLPGWLADSLVNILHLIPECSIWGQAKPPIGDWCPEEDGVFGMNESPRGCSQIECIPCSFYGNIPLNYFFPDTALSTLRGYKAYQFPDGRPPWVFGGCTARDSESKKSNYGLARPDKGYQTVLNTACYVVMVDRYWQATGDDAMLEEFWDSLKRANDFSLNLRPKYGLSQVVAMPEPGIDSYVRDTEWFEAEEPGWMGYVTHAGAVRMAQVRIMQRMAAHMLDAAYGEKCDAWLQAGAETLEEKLWNGSCYLNYYDPESDEKSDLVFGYQLGGQWIANWQGVPGVFPKDRAEATLKTIREINCCLSQTGAVNYAQPDGSPAKVGGYGTYSYFLPELFMLAMTFMYEGEREFGMDLLYRCVENYACTWGCTWDAFNTVRGECDTGQRAFGSDYYQNMMLWAVPAALAGGDQTAPCRPGGLVDRMLKAGKVSAIVHRNSGKER